MIKKKKRRKRKSFTTDKELLEEIKKLREAILEENDFLTRCVLANVFVSLGYMDYLIKQAGRVQELEKQNKRYREALEFYADKNNYREQELKGIVPPRIITFKPILHDYGSIAREALEGEK